MTDRQKFIFTLLLAGVACIVESFAGQMPLAIASVKKMPDLSLEDCGKCHAKVIQTLNAFGLSHKTRLTCVDCHHGHPPEDTNIIPSCKKCHKDSAHFKIDNCSSCHYNAHSPRKLRFPSRTTAPCLTCHTTQEADLEKYPSKHTAEGCTACHETHGLVPVCVGCHRPHSPEMIKSDCRLCHSAHKPKQIRYDSSVPSQFCVTCHAKINKILTSGNTLHKNLRCATCHKSTHGKIPACVECHPPHSAQSTAQGGCKMCHQQAHAPVPVVAVHFAKDTSSATCGACHGATLEALRAGKSKHHTFECLTCHKDDHGTIPKCQDCHGVPHSEGLLKNFSGCGECHGSAHAIFK